MKPNDRYTPFSNGTEHLMWLEGNCQRGERGCRRYNPNAPTSRHGCPIEVGVTLGSVTDGTMRAGLALRGGLCVEGPGGEIVDRPVGTIPACPEYRGYDEPDDKPHRGPRPPEGQLDLLDPRNQPSRERVA